MSQHEPIADRFAVLDVICSWSLAIDHKDWAAVRGVFAEEVHVDYSAFGRPEQSGSIDDFIELWQARIAHLTATQHLFGNERVHISGDTAQVEMYYIDTHILATARGGNRWQMGAAT